MLLIFQEMSEHPVSLNDQKFLNIRLATSRHEAAGFGASDRDSPGQNSGAVDQTSFGEEWLDEGDEACLHAMMDCLDNENQHGNASEINNEDSSKVNVLPEFSENIVQTQSCNKDVTECAITPSLRTHPSISLTNSQNCNTNNDKRDAILRQENEVSLCNITKKSQDVEAEKSDSTSTEDNTASDSSSVSNAHANSNSKPLVNSETDNEMLDSDESELTLPDFMTPLQQYKGKYLWVSDLTAQAWCERQLLYDISFEGPVELLETPAMKVGTEMHLKRELEVHTIKEIKVTSREDKWAVKFLNIMSATSQLLQGIGDGSSRCVIREMPIFGRPFQSGTFVVGVIDEIRFNVKGQLELVEFKTRAKARTVPSKAQRMIHKLQVMLYKQLFDELVTAQLSKQTIMDTIKLDPEAEVNEEIVAHASGLGLEVKKFSDLLDITLDRFQFLPKIDSLVVEYSSQDDKSPFAVDEFPFDPVWLSERLEFYNAFWEGKREVEGVDIEDAWKCNYCNYVDGCDWRQKMHEKLVKQNAAKRVKIELTK